MTIWWRDDARRRDSKVAMIRTVTMIAKPKLGAGGRSSAPEKE